MLSKPAAAKMLKSQTFVLPWPEPESKSENPHHDQVCGVLSALWERMLTVAWGFWCTMGVDAKRLKNPRRRKGDQPCRRE